MVELADFFSTIGTIISFGLSFTPTVPFMKVFKGEEKIDILPEGVLLFLILTRLVWGSVWVLTGRKIALLNSVLGIAVCDVFVVLYFYLFFNRSCTKAFFSCIILLLLEVGIMYGGVFWGNHVVLSYTAMVFNVLMFISPGQKIIRVIREKNYKLIPIFTTIVNIMCSAAWLGYGICINLITQIIPNSLGLLFSIANTLAWLYFYLKRDKDKEEEEEKEKEKDAETELVEK